MTWDGRTEASDAQICKLRGNLKVTYSLPNVDNHSTNPQESAQAGLVWAVLVLRVH